MAINRKAAGDLHVCEVRMNSFGKSRGGGRRKAHRDQMPLLAVISTVDDERRVGVINVSRNGVQLTSPDLPGDGEMVIFQSESVQSFGHVAWSSAGQCGIAFAGPISADQVEQLRREASIAVDLPYLSFAKVQGEAA